jgi:hypothetical protein
VGGCAVQVYLRHCLLAVEKLGQVRVVELVFAAGLGADGVGVLQDVYEDFVTTTFLGDRKTTIKEYIEANPTIMLEQPPPHLADRYSG